MDSKDFKDGVTNMDSKDFKERSRRPRISKAETLAQALANVREDGRAPYQYTADAPCHQSKNPGAGDSFHFGNALGGGLVVSCWSCLKAGGAGSAREMVERIEDRLGCGLQVRWPGSGGLRYNYGAREVSAGNMRHMFGDAAPAQGQGRSSPVRWFATQGGETFTVQDLQETPVWLAGWSAKKPWQQRRRDGQAPYAFRQSLAPEDGNLVVARYGGDGTQRLPGGKVIPIRVRPWAPLAAILSGITRLLNPAGIFPVLALSGSTEHPSPLDVLVIDLDYAPGSDTEGVGRAFRIALAETLVQAGAPMFRSTSGNGWHALVREDADFLREAQENGTEVRFPEDPEENIGNSAFAEMFPAGTKRLVLLRWEKPMFNTDPGQVIPVVSREWLRSALLDARAKAEGREALAPQDLTETTEAQKNTETTEAQKNTESTESTEAQKNTESTAPMPAPPVPEAQDGCWNPMADFWDDWELEKAPDGADGTGSFAATPDAGDGETQEAAGETQITPDTRGTQKASGPRSGKGPDLTTRAGVRAARRAPGWKETH